MLPRRSVGKLRALQETLDLQMTDNHLAHKALVERRYNMVLVDNDDEQ
jgi:hypothetical protein